MGNPGTCVAEFFSRFPNEESCLDYIFQRKWADHTPCPTCGRVGGWSRIKGTKKYLHNCRKHHSVLKGTAFYRSNLSLMASFYALLLFCNSSNGVRSVFIRKQLGIGLKAAHRLCNTIRLHMAMYDRPAQLGGENKSVYVDELYLRRVRCQSSKRFVAKKILGFSCEGKIVSAIIPDRKSATLLAAIEKTVLPGSKIITDNWCGYARIPSLGFEHVSVNHSRGQWFDHEGHSTVEIDTYWAVVRRTLRLYHQVADANLWLFLAEIECRYNHRRSSQSLFDTLVANWPDLEAIGIERVRERYDWQN